MKKLLLVLMGTAALSLSAQDDCVSSTGFIDSYDASEAPSDGNNLSLGYWGSSGGVYDFTRNNGDLEITVDQAQGGWTPMGFTFSESVDLTGNTLDISLTNDGSDGIEVYFSLISNNTTGVDAERITATNTGSLFGGVVSGGATVNYSFDISNGRIHQWVASSDDCTDGTMAGSYCMRDKGFDITKVTGIEWTINGAASAETGWSNPELIAHPVKIHSIGSGTCTNGGGDNSNDGGDDSNDGGDDSNDGDDNSDGDTNGQACNDLDDHGHGTWYDNLDVQPNGVVKCTFERDSILNTKYGALDKGLLQESNDAKYCGMCVEAIAPDHNNVPVIIQIVDECPDCYDRNSDGSINTGVNTKFGDIDLSITAFKALLQEDHVALGIGDFDWKEVSCPWQKPLHLIFQGSHDWYAKVIVANHVNRIATVEISNDGGSSWELMERGEDNGFVKGSYGGETKAFKITDIYGSEIIMNNIDMVTNGNNIVDGSENFPACGLTTSTQDLNTLDYVTAFPNPANSSITFVGIEDVEKMEIVSVNGQVVASKNFQTSTAQISLDISQLAPGLYVAKMTGENNTGVVTFVKK
ncbi:MAG: hypothetical protein CMP67_06485 [Flavobacteriales bacterium]|nr:hypothetical protein [Flavobacteriales bacterium]